MLDGTFVYLFNVVLVARLEVFHLQSCWCSTGPYFLLFMISYFVFIRPVGARRDLFSSSVLLVLDGTIFLSRYDFFFCFHSSCWCLTGPYFFLVSPYDFCLCFGISFSRWSGCNQSIFSACACQNKGVTCIPTTLLLSVRG